MNKPILSAMLCVALATGALAGCADQQSAETASASEAEITAVQESTVAEKETETDVQSTTFTASTA